MGQTFWALSWVMVSRMNRNSLVQETPTIHTALGQSSPLYGGYCYSPIALRIEGMAICQEGAWKLFQAWCHIATEEGLKAPGRGGTFRLPAKSDKEVVFSSRFVYHRAMTSTSGKGLH